MAIRPTGIEEPRLAAHIAIIGTGPKHSGGGLRERSIRPDGCISPKAIFCGDSLLGLKPWETSPLDADSKTPHVWMSGNPQESAGISLGDAVRVGVVMTVGTSRAEQRANGRDPIWIHRIRLFATNVRFAPRVTGTPLPTSLSLVYVPRITIGSCQRDVPMSPDHEAVGRHRAYVDHDALPEDTA